MTLHRKTVLAHAMPLLLAASTSFAAGLPSKREPFNGLDISGVYHCVGNDAHDGDFKSTMTIKLDPRYSSGKLAAFQVSVKGDADVYTGSMVSNGQQLAMDFANTDASKADFGVSLATVETIAKGRYRISKFYYQSQYQGGSNGFEVCTST